MAPEVLGTGFRWAFDGEPGHGVLRGPDGAVVDPATIEGPHRLGRIRAVGGYCLDWFDLVNSATGQPPAA